MALGRGSKDAYRDIVSNGDFDSFTIAETTDGNTIYSTIKDVSSRIKQCELI